MERRARMLELIHILNDAREKYYSGTDESPLTDAQYDRYLKELIELEESTGIRIPDSPTNKVGFTEDTGNKVKHYKPILSLKDTKSIDKLEEFLEDREGILSWKIDGLSIVLYYKNGKLDKALSRGDGLYGRDITKNVIFLQNVPITIPIFSDVIIRGEGCLSRDEFENIKKTPEGEKYSNPRNMASGLINTIRTTSLLLKHMCFVAHTVILLEAELIKKSQQLTFLSTIGFSVVPYLNVTADTLRDTIHMFTSQVDNYIFPVDGLVLSLDDIAYSESLGSTANYPKHSMAFKWPDVEKKTRVVGITWNVGKKTGQMTPVVIFEPVWLEGTEVKQASLHNLKAFQDLEIGIGDEIIVFKANKIIPEVKENLTKSGTETYPTVCPICGHETTVVTNDRTRKLYCYQCAGKIN